MKQGRFSEEQIVAIVKEAESGGTKVGVRCTLVSPAAINAD
jgi:imidazolonepropionase-like amidohydrolase